MQAQKKVKPASQVIALVPEPLVVLDLDFEIDPAIPKRVQGPLWGLVQDALRFASGEINRRDLEDAIQSYALAVQEMQTECECLHPARNTKFASIFVANPKCPVCAGAGWRWKTE